MTIQNTQKATVKIVQNIILKKIEQPGRSGYIYKNLQSSKIESGINRKSK